jgi:hypothetical protein
MADEAGELQQWVARLAEDLAQENAGDFLKAFDRPVRERMESNIWALVRQAELASSVAVVAVSAAGDQRVLDLDWYLYVKPHAASGIAEQRRQRVKMTVEKVKKSWRAVGVEDQGLFNAPQ